MPPPDQPQWARTALAFILTTAAGGAAGAAFLTSLDAVTRLNHRYGWLLFLLPFLGVAIWRLYDRLGGPAGRGTNLLIEQARESNPRVPFRLAPLIFASTLLTHLGGGSAGREGTAVQMGGGIAGGAAELLGIHPTHRRMLLLAGMAAGFGAVFGTPASAAVFAVECIHPRRPDWRSAPLCLLAAWGAHLTCIALGGTHAHYDLGLPAASQLQWRDIHLAWIPGCAILGLAAGGVARLFIVAGKISARTFAQIPQPWLRPVGGAATLMLLTMVLGDRSYLGLGAFPLIEGGVAIQTAFEPAAVPPWAWAIKLAFTVITLGSGFKGGEVTPLFFIGATAGHVAAPYLGLPTAVGAAIGLSSVFAGASRTPAACSLLGLELFGLAALPYVAAACFLSRLSAGKDSIYEAQPKPDEATVGDRGEASR